MKHRTFGRLGWEVSELGYGMWGVGGWTASDDDESQGSLQIAVELSNAHGVVGLAPWA